MSDIFAMQRANGDWFAFDHRGHLRVPLFHSRRDAMIARMRNFGLLVFKPVLLNTRFLNEIVPLPGEDEVDFCMVDDPYARLNRCTTVERTQLASLIRPDEHENITTDGNAVHPFNAGASPKADSEATETWEDEGGRTKTAREVLRA